MKRPDWLARDGWLVVTPTQAPANDKRLDRMYVQVHIRRWHPGWWLVLARAMWMRGRMTCGSSSWRLRFWSGAVIGAGLALVVFTLVTHLTFGK